MTTNPHEHHSPLCASSRHSSSALLAAMITAFSNPLSRRNSCEAVRGSVGGGEGTYAWFACQQERGLQQLGIVPPCAPCPTRFPLAARTMFLPLVGSEMPASVSTDRRADSRTWCCGC